MTDIKVLMTSLELARITGKEHKNVLRDIDREVSRLKEQLFNPKISSEQRQAIESMLDSFLETEYIDKRLKPQRCYYLLERAVYQMSARYSEFVRCVLIDSWLKRKDAYNNTILALATDSSTYKENKGHVYVIESQGAVKIGFTTDLKERLNQAQTWSPYKVSYSWHSLPCTNFREIELLAHNHFKDKQLKGAGREWFDISVEEAVDFLIDQEYTTLITVNTKPYLTHIPCFPEE